MDIITATLTFGKFGWLNFLWLSSTVLLEKPMKSISLLAGQALGAAPVSRSAAILLTQLVPNGLPLTLKRLLTRL